MMVAASLVTKSLSMWLIMILLRPKNIKLKGLICQLEITFFSHLLNDQYFIVVVRDEAARILPLGPKEVRVISDKS